MTDLRAGPRTLVRRDHRPANASANIVGVTLLFTAAGMAVCGVLALASGDDGWESLAGSAAAAALVGVALWRGTRMPARVSTASASSAVGSTWIAI